MIKRHGGETVGKRNTDKKQTLKKGNVRLKNQADGWTDRGGSSAHSFANEPTNEVWKGEAKTAVKEVWDEKKEKEEEEKEKENEKEIEKQTEKEKEKRRRKRKRKKRKKKY